MSAIAHHMPETLVWVRPTLLERAALRLAVGTERLVARRIQRRAELIERVAMRHAAGEDDRIEAERLRAASFALGSHLF